MWHRQTKIIMNNIDQLSLAVTFRKEISNLLNATFNKISVISCRSVLLVEETVVPGENHRPVASHWQTLSHNVVSYFKLRSLVVICTDCISSCKSNYHMITNMTTPVMHEAKQSYTFESYTPLLALFFYYYHYNPTQMEKKTRWLLFSNLHVMSSLYAYR
jgi:hypothetical protein